MIGVAGRDELAAIQGFIDQRGVAGFPHIVDETGDVWSSFDVRSQPAYVFVDDDGTLENTGSLSEASLVERVEALIAG